MSTVAQAESIGRRLGLACAAGLVPGVVLSLADLLISGQLVCRSEWFGCLGAALLIYPLAVLVAVALAWLALRRGQVLDAWRVALLGPVAAWGVGRLLSQSPLPQVAVFLLMGVLGYLAAAVVTATGLAWWWRLLAGVLAVGPALLLTLY